MSVLYVRDKDGNLKPVPYISASGADIGGVNVPDYWKTELDAGVKAINTAMLEAGYNKAAFLFYTDVHWNNGSQMSPKLLKYLYEHTGMNKTFFGGDVVLNESNNYDTMAYLWDWRNKLKGLPNHHSVPGNHDDGNTTNNLFSEQYVYGYLLAPEETPDIIRGESGLYYYIDNPAERTRYLFLDTAFQTVLYDAKQAQFVVDALKNTPAGWHIVVVAHIWYNVDYSVKPYVVTGLSYAGNLLLNLFDKYNSRGSGSLSIAASSTDNTSTSVPYDFTGCGGKVEFCIGGHCHIDYDGSSTGGIPVILCEPDCWDVRSGLDYSSGTTGESSVNGIIANYDTGEITVVRVGRGDSRVVNGSGGEEPETPTGYKNVLDEVGYSENKRWSTSSESETTATGWDLTGYIPCTVGDVIRLKNVTWYPTSENSGRGGLIWFDSNKTRINNSSITTTDGLTKWNPVYDDAGNVVQITVPNVDSERFAFLRICCQDINEDSIITVNEEIA